MLLDDSASNIKTAKHMGWNTVLVGTQTRAGAKVDRQNADAAVDAIHEIQQVLPKLFVPVPPFPLPAPTSPTKVIKAIPESKTDRSYRMLEPLASHSDVR